MILMLPACRRRSRSRRCSSRLLHGAVVRRCTAAAALGPDAVHDCRGRARLRDRIARGHLRRAGRRHRGRRDVAAAAGLRGPPADARRGRHLVPRRPTARRWFRMDEHRRDVPLARDPGRTCSTPSSPSRITASTAIPASIRSRSAAPSSATSAPPGTVEGGSTLTQQLARTLFLSNKQDLRPQGPRGGARADDRRAALARTQILELYLNRIYSERRRLRRRDDVAASVRASRPSS